MLYLFLHAMEVPLLQKPLVPEDMRGVIQAHANDPKQLNTQLVRYARHNMGAMKTVLTDTQYETFHRLFEQVEVPIESMVDILGKTWGIDFLQSCLLFSLSREINPEDDSVKDSLDIFAAVFGGMNFRKFLEVSSLEEIRKQLSKFEHAEMFRYCLQIPECVNKQVNSQTLYETRALIEQRMKLFNIWGISTRKMDKPIDIIRALLQGVSTVSIMPTSAHGQQKAPGFFSFMHDLYHFYRFCAVCSSSLEQFTLNQLYAEVVASEFKSSVNDLLEPTVKESLRRYKILMGRLEKFLEQHSKDVQVVATLFFLLHESVHFTSDDWKDYENLPVLIGKWVALAQKDMQKEDHTEWTSVEDPFETDPVTGVSEKTDEEILDAFKQIHQRKLQDIPEALLSFRIERTNRFIKVFVKSPLEFEERMYIVATTLYHKRLNARDMYYLLGGEEGTGLLKPDTLQKREETIVFLNKLYKVNLVRAFRHTVEKAKIESNTLSVG